MASSVTEETKEGFTGKEQDEETGLYYFGARYYDAALGRWSAVDPAGQFATPYGYATDPLLYVDPDGESFILTAILVGAAIGAVSHTAQTVITGQRWDWGKFGRSVVMGAVSGAVSAGVGSAFGSVGNFGHELARAGVHGITQQGVGMAFGQDPSIGGFLAATGGSLLGSGLHKSSTAVQIGGSAAFGGAVSEISDPGSFWQGFATSAIVAGTNHTLHTIDHRIKVRRHTKAVRAFLEDSGFSPEKISNDIVIQDDGFFKKYYAKFVGDIDTYGDFFTGGQFDSFSKTYDAYISKSRSMSIEARARDGLRNTLAIKYYPSRAHSIGLTKTGLNHFYEAFYESLDGKVRQWTGNDNVIYNMHGINTDFYLRFRKWFE